MDTDSRFAGGSSSYLKRPFPAASVGANGLSVLPFHHKSVGKIMFSIDVSTLAEWLSLGRGVRSLNDLNVTCK